MGSRLDRGKVEGRLGSVVERLEILSAGGEGDENLASVDERLKQLLVSQTMTRPRHKNGDVLSDTFLELRKIAMSVKAEQNTRKIFEEPTLAAES